MKTKKSKQVTKRGGFEDWLKKVRVLNESDHKSGISYRG